MLTPDPKEAVSQSLWIRVFFLLNKILPHKPELNEELEVRNGVGVERHLGGLFLSKIGVFEDYKSKRLYLQFFLFVPFKWGIK